MKISAIVTRLLRVESLVAYLLTNLGHMRQMSIKSIQGDYLVCNPITSTGAVDNTIDKNVAKSYLLRRTPFESGSRNGISYNYTSNVARTASGSAGTENQVVVPAYIVGDLILVRKVIPSTTVEVGGVAVSLIDMNSDARAWAKKKE